MRASIKNFELEPIKYDVGHPVNQVLSLNMFSFQSQLSLSPILMPVIIYDLTHPNSAFSSRESIRNVQLLYVDVLTHPNSAFSSRESLRNVQLLYVDVLTLPNCAFSSRESIRNVQFPNVDVFIISIELPCLEKVIFAFFRENFTLFTKQIETKLREKIFPFSLENLETTELIQSFFPNSMVPFTVKPFEFFTN